MKIYKAELYRFGYCLEVVSDDPDTARANLIKEYKRAYKNINGTGPTKDELNNVKEDLEDIEEVELNKVEWR